MIYDFISSFVLLALRSVMTADNANQGSGLGVRVITQETNNGLWHIFITYDIEVEIFFWLKAKSSFSVPGGLFNFQKELLKIIFKTMQKAIELYVSIYESLYMSLSI